MSALIQHTHTILSMNAYGYCDRINSASATASSVYLSKCTGWLGSRLWLLQPKGGILPSVSSLWQHRPADIVTGNGWTHGSSRPWVAAVLQPSVWAKGVHGASYAAVVSCMGSALLWWAALLRNIRPQLRGAVGASVFCRCVSLHAFCFS